MINFSFFNADCDQDNDDKVLFSVSDAEYEDNISYIFISQMLAAYLVWSRWLEPESAVAEVDFLTQFY